MWCATPNVVSLMHNVWSYDQAKAGLVSIAFLSTFEVKKVTDVLVHCKEMY